MTALLSRRLLVALSLATTSGIGCYDPKLVTAPDDILLLSATPGTIPADGFSRAEIVARVDPSSSRALRVLFSTSGGTLSSRDARSPDSNGQVSVFLTSEAAPKSVLVTAEVKDGETVVASRSVAVVFEQAAASSVIRMALSASQLEADGASSVQLRAEVNPSLTNRAVTFVTTAGSFEAGRAVTTLANVPTGADGVARAQLYAPRTIGTALVTASAGGFSAGENVTFVVALPDAIALRAKPLEQSRSSETNIIAVEATLSRTVGRVTPNVRVDFTAVNDASGESFGRFQNVKRSTDEELATADFVPGTAAPLGLATITARASDSNVVARIKVTITGP